MAAAARSAQQPWVVGASAGGSSGSPCVRQAPRQLLPSHGLQQGFQLPRLSQKLGTSHLRLLPPGGARQHGLRAVVRAQAQQPQQPPRRAESPGPGIAGRPRPPAAAAAGSGAYAIIAAADAPPSAASERSGGGAAAPPPPPQQEPPPPPGGEQAAKDEPEVVLLMVACGIGLATGAAIVAFNVAVHEIRDWIWAHQSLLASNRELLRNIAESELWPKVVFPPLVGGLLVGALGFAIGGYEDKPPPRLGQQGGSTSSGSGSGQPDTGAAGAYPTGGASSGSSTSAALEAWRLQMAAVLRPVSRAVAAAITLGTGDHDHSARFQPATEPQPAAAHIAPRRSWHHPAQLTRHAALGQQHCLSPPRWHVERRSGAAVASALLSPPSLCPCCRRLSGPRGPLCRHRQVHRQGSGRQPAQQAAAPDLPAGSGRGRGRGGGFQRTHCRCARAPGQA